MVPIKFRAKLCLVPRRKINELFFTLYRPVFNTFFHFGAASFIPNPITSNEGDSNNAPSIAVKSIRLRSLCLKSLINL